MPLPPEPSPPALPDESSEDDLARVLELVRERTGLDFSGYRIPTLRRRVRNRMITVSARSMGEYVERLSSDPEEALRLVERLTIKVSRFFRDEYTFSALREALGRRALERSSAPLRAWSAGCGHGEESYSLAVLLADLGPPSGAPDVLGTDIDPAALAFAREATYAEGSMVGISPDARARIFEAAGPSSPGAWRVRAELRARTAFELHDLAGGEQPPPGRFDLACCRNVLIYLKPAVQERAQMLLARSLLAGGLLCLGEAEWLLPAVKHHFDVIDRKARLFSRRAEPTGVAA